MDGTLKIAGTKYECAVYIDFRARYGVIVNSSFNSVSTCSISISDNKASGSSH